METIVIKDVYGKVLFSHSQEGNSIKATLEKAVSIGVDLSNAYLSGAELCNANLGSAYLRGANLSGANLKDAYLSGANLKDAYLIRADLRDADLIRADLRDADLYGAVLSNANLIRAINIPFIPLACPSEGEFIGWKKVGGYLIKLKIPADAKRCSATTNKCRCDKAEVLSIIEIKSGEEIESIVNNSYNDCEYKVGEMVYPDSFDENRWNECSNGIHFFVNKQEAINY